MSKYKSIIWAAAMVIIAIALVTVRYNYHYYKVGGLIKDGHTVVDYRGHEWGYCNKYQTGTQVMITFDDMHTDETITDDCIIKVEID